MARLLYVQASPRTDRSYSTAVADAFVKAYLAAHPDDEATTLNVFRRDLPALDGPALQAKYSILHGAEATDEEKAAWRAVEETVEEFLAADKYIFAVPMWNFGIPYRLKHYIDLLVQPGYTFRVAEGGGFEGLVTGRPAFLVYARGGEYAPGTPTAHLDMQKHYLELILGFIGFGDMTSVIVEPTLMGGPDVAKTRREAAIEEARRLAAEF